MNLLAGVAGRLDQRVDCFIKLAGTVGSIRPVSCNVADLGNHSTCVGECERVFACACVREFHIDSFDSF